MIFGMFGEGLVISHLRMAGGQTVLGIPGPEKPKNPKKKPEKNLKTFLCWELTNLTGVFCYKRARATDCFDVPLAYLVDVRLKLRLRETLI